MASKQEALAYWKEGAKRDRETAKDLIESNHNDWALFIWHLVIEKLLKGLLIKEDKRAVRTHNLFRLATDLKKNSVPKEYLEWLKEITTFNLEAQYSSYKFEFYKKATKEYTATWDERWDERCEEIFRWLLERY